MWDKVIKVTKFIADPAYALHGNEFTTFHTGSAMGFKKFFSGVDSSYWGNVTRASTIGLHLVSGIAVGALIGYLLDMWLETSPWCFIAFVVVGICAGFRNVYLDTKRLVNSQDTDNDRNDPPQR